MGHTETQSSDGTTIRWLQYGDRPKLVLVHGGLSTPDDYRELCGMLSETAGVAAMGRRGYGLSDDGPAYSYTAEAEDVLAVAEAASHARCVMGHSSGAVCALLAARDASIDKAVLYEPPFPVDGPLLPSDRRRAAESAIAEGDYEEAITIGLVHGVKMSVEDVAALKSLPMWPAMLALAPAWIREFEQLDSMTDLSWCRELRSQVLLLWGSQTQAHHRRAVECLLDLLPNAVAERLDGAGHHGPLTAAQSVGHAVIDFLT